MLMTFDQFAHIPDKIHIFYEQAFETLFFRHDASKQSAFRRKMYTDIAINDFKNCLSAISVSSYNKEKYLFTESEILDYIRTAMKFEKMDVDVRGYLRDLLESVCILQRDGLFITFSHRSFQEYFAASFIARSPSIPIAPLLDRFSDRISDSVIAMAFDMNRPLVERDWVLPKIKELMVELHEASRSSNIVLQMNVLYGDIIFGDFKDLDGNYYINNLSTWANFVMCLQRIYGQEFPPEPSPSEFADDRKRDTEIINKALRKRGVEGKIDFSKGKPVRSDDQPWFRETSFGRHSEKLISKVSLLAEKIEQSVEEQRTIAGDLFS
jgi:hypothetical protein